MRQPGGFTPPLTFQLKKTAIASADTCSAGMLPFGEAGDHVVSICAVIECNVPPSRLLRMMSVNEHIQINRAQRHIRVRAATSFLPGYSAGLVDDMHRVGNAAIVSDRFGPLIVGRTPVET